MFSYVFFLLAIASWQETREKQLNFERHCGHVLIALPVLDYDQTAEFITGTIQILCYFVVEDNQSFSKSFKNLSY